MEPPVSQEINPIRRVLIVDDSRMVRASLIRHIRDRFEVREEADGEAAWQTLLVDPSIQLVISDIGMPHLDGFGLLERIRTSRLPRIQELPVIIISGEEEGEAREKARSLGANDFITKGVGTAELLARLDSLAQLNEARRQLEASRAALQQQAPVDPVSGLQTKAYLDARGEQDLSLARRHHTAVSAMVVAIDDYDTLLARYGAHVMQLILRKLMGILTAWVRKEDTVAEQATGQMAVLSPATDLEGCHAFGVRLQQAIEKVVLTYREERIRITVTVGIAASSEDGADSAMERLLALATERARQGQGLGGNRVHGPEAALVASPPAPPVPVSIDQLIAALRNGEAAGSQIPWRDVVRHLMPLLERIESESRCGIPLARLAQFAQANTDVGHASENATPG
ncbi:MAG: response regulator [Zoogloeaceae bacterium]|nr:response regulator [Zoogloeaceae bacterium]